MMNTHIAPESMLLYALGRPLEAGVEAALARHLGRCGGCRDRLDVFLADRLGGAEEDEADAPLRAAASAARTWDAPAAATALGRIEVAGGPDAQIFRRPGEGVFALGGRHDLAGRALALTLPDRAETMPLALDRFGRFRLDAAQAEALERALSAGSPLRAEVT